MHIYSTHERSRARALVAKMLMETLESRILLSSAPDSFTLHLTPAPPFAQTAFLAPNPKTIAPTTLGTTIAHAPNNLAAPLPLVVAPTTKPLLVAPVIPLAQAPNPDTSTTTTITAAGASAAVVGRYIYYGATARFGDVLASDKSVLLPNATANFTNVTSYTGGINELMIDVTNASATYGAGDFVFRVGQSGDPYTWSLGPAPASVSVTAGAGTGGSSRVTLRWNAGAIINQWLQVIFTPASDTFYVGNLVGDLGNLQVTAATETTVRTHSTTLLSPATITNIYDFNRDGRVDATDQLVARAAAGATLTALAAPPVPVPPPAYDWHTQTINGALNIWAPNPSNFGTTFTVTDPTKLFGPDGIPQIEGVHQSSIADCYFLSATGSLAYSNPSRIQSLVQNDAGGGWAVTFQSWNTPTNSYVPLVIHTSNQLSSTKQVVSNNEVWSLVLEKAYAAFRTWNGVTSTNTLDSLGWGFAGSALTDLNDPYQYVSISSTNEAAVYATLQTALTAHQPILYQTSSSAPTMVKSHVYVITGVSTDANGVRWVNTYNPWGFYDTRKETDLLANGIGALVVGAH